MFWKFVMETTMDQGNSQAHDYLIINRVQLLSECGCSACGGGFSQSPAGDKALVVTVGEGGKSFIFCGGCGDNIMGRISSDDVRKHYVWDWAIPLRNGRPATQSS
jgi:hypothetical protein